MTYFLSIVVMLCYGFQFVWRQSAGLVESRLCPDYLLEHFAYTSYYISPYLFGYAMVQIPCGILLDRVHVSKFGRFMLSVGMIGIIIYLAHMYYRAPLLGMASRFITGIAFGTIYNIATRIILVTKKDDLDFSKKIGNLFISGILISIFSEPILSRSISYFGWQNAMITLCITGLIVISSFIVISKIFFIQDNKSPSINIKSDAKFLMTSTQFLLLIVYGGILYSSMMFGDSVGLNLLKGKYQIPQDSAVFIKVTASLGTIFGLRFWKYLSYYIGAKNTMLICIILNLLAVACLAAPIYLHHFTLYIIFFMLGCSVGTSPIVTPHYVGIAQKSRESLAISCSNMICWVCFSSITYITNLLLYMYNDYLIALIPMMALSSIGIFLVTKVKW